VNFRYLETYLIRGRCLLANEVLAFQLRERPEQDRKNLIKLIEAGCPGKIINCAACEFAENHFKFDKYQKEQREKCTYLSWDVYPNYTDVFYYHGPGNLLNRGCWEGRWISQNDIDQAYENFKIKKDLFNKKLLPEVIRKENKYEFEK